jgi:phosphate/sulfate permease
VPEHLFFSAETKEEAMLPLIIQGAFLGATLSVPFVIITGLLKISGLFAIGVFIVFSPLLGFTFTYLFSLVLSAGSETQIQRR